MKLVQSGIFISLASMFSFSYSIYLPGAIIILSIFTRSTIRKYLLVVFGFLLPHLLLICIFNLKGHATESYGRIITYITWASRLTTSLAPSRCCCFCTVPLFYLFVSLFILNRDARLTKYQSQIFQMMFLWFWSPSRNFYCCRFQTSKVSLPCSPPVSFFLTHFLLLIRRRKFTEMNTLILTVGIVVLAYLTRYQKFHRSVSGSYCAGKQRAGSE